MDAVVGVGRARWKTSVVEGTLWIGPNDEIWPPRKNVGLFLHVRHSRTTVWENRGRKRFTRKTRNPRRRRKRKGNAAGEIVVWITGGRQCCTAACRGWWSCAVELREKRKRKARESSFSFHSRSNKNEENLSRVPARPGIVGGGVLGYSSFKLPFSACTYNSAVLKSGGGGGSSRCSGEGGWKSSSPIYLSPQMLTHPLYLIPNLSICLFYEERSRLVNGEWGKKEKKKFSAVLMQLFGGKTARSRSRQVSSMKLINSNRFFQAQSSSIPLKLNKNYKIQKRSEQRSFSGILLMELFNSGGNSSVSFDFFLNKKLLIFKYFFLSKNEQIASIHTPLWNFNKKSEEFHFFQHQKQPKPN